MREVVIMVEEASMQAFLEPQLSRLLPPGHFGRVIPHQGKSDLQHSIPRKLRAWRKPDTLFVILHDQDGADCEALKGSLVALCTEAGKPEALVRIVCQNLESWVLGDLAALGEAFADARLAELDVKAKYRNPDLLSDGIHELRRLVPSYQKVGGARQVAQHHSAARNSSPSFQVFAQGLARVTEAAP